jgi:HEPN domain-containing protein
MRKLKLLLGFIVLGVLFVSCSKEKGDREKVVEMTIYPETGFGTFFMSKVWTQPLIFSDNDENKKETLINTITEGFNFDYERGFEYKLKVKKIWMLDPPQDVSSIKYVFLELVSKERVITENSEEIINLFVESETIKFTPKYPNEYQSDQTPMIYDALKVKDANNWMALTEIEGFDFEAGYEYELSVKKVTQAVPYAIKYVLVDVISKKIKS